MSEQTKTPRAYGNVYIDGDNMLRRILPFARVKD